MKKNMTKRNTAFLLIAAIIIVMSVVLILAPQSVQNLIGQVALVFGFARG